jgi:hypothetical protein
VKVGDIVKIGTWGGEHRKEIYVITREMSEQEKHDVDMDYVILQTTGDGVGLEWYVHKDEITLLKDTL